VNFKTQKHLPTILAFAALLPLVGCVTPPPPKPVVAPVVEVAPSPPPETPEQIAARETNAAARVALKEGIDAYTAGDYNGALKHLSGSNDIWSSETTIQLDALKYMAFSYCLTNRKTLCRQQFEKAFKLDANFELLAGEKGHPLWGPAFDQAKKAK
jgi:hypothetical protein